MSARQTPRVRVQETVKSIASDALRGFFSVGYRVQRNREAIVTSAFYEARLFEVVSRAVTHSLDKFDGQSDLPRAYGVGLSERAVELPWVLQNLGPADGLHLDAGSSLNFNAILDHPRMRKKDVIISNLNPERNCYWTNRVSYVFHDLRVPFFTENLFDTISCVSVLEHVGLNNDRYTDDPRYREESGDFASAVRELHRILKPGGSCLVTVPFGARANHGWLQVFDIEMINRLVDAFGPTQVSVSYFRYDAGGWHRAEGAECANGRYASSYPGLIGQVGAEAVACLHLRK